MSTDEPTRAPDEGPEERRPDVAADRPWVAPSSRADGRPVPADETPTSPEPLPVVAPPTGAPPPQSPTPTAAYPPAASYPAPGSNPASAYPPPGAAPPSPSQRLPYGPPPTGSPPAGEAAPPTGPVARRRNPVGLVAFILGVVAFVLAVLPIASFVAGLPALAAIVLGIIGLVLAGRRRGFAAAGLIIGVVALIVAIAVSTVQAVTFVRDRVTDLPQVSDFPSGFPSDAPSGDSSSGGGLAAGSHTVVYRITGSGRASITYSTIANGRSATARDTQVTLPRTRAQHLTLTTDGSQQFLLAAITLDGAAKLGCSIEVDGTVIAHNTSSASSGVELVTCLGREGGS